MLLHQDAKVFATLIDGKAQLIYRLKEGRNAYLHVARGKAQANGVNVSAGDALMYQDDKDIILESAADAELLLFDLP